MSHSAEKFRKGILLFLRKFLVSKSLMDEKGGITFFRRKFLVSVPKHFVEQAFCTAFQKTSGSEKVYG